MSARILRKIHASKREIEENINGDYNFSGNGSILPLKGFATKGDVVKLISQEGEQRCFITKIHGEQLEKLGSLHGNIVIKALAADSEGVLYFTGWFSGSITFGSGSGSFQSSEKESKDLYLGAINEHGILFVKPVIGIENDIGTDLYIDADDNVYVLGTFEDSITFDNIYLFTKTRSIFVAKFDCETKGWIWARKLPGTSGRFCVNDKKTYLSTVICYDETTETVDDLNPPISLGNKGGGYLAKLSWNDGSWFIQDRKPIIVADLDTPFIDIWWMNGWIIHDQKKGMDRINNNGIVWSYDNEQLTIIGIFDGEIFMTSRQSSLIVIDGESGDIRINIRLPFLSRSSIYGAIRDTDGDLIIAADMLYKITTNGELIWSKNIGHKQSIDILYQQNGIYYLAQAGEIFRFQEDDRTDPCLGIVTEIGYIDDETHAEIEFHGRARTGFDNLIPGRHYYVQPNGRLGLTTNKFYFGTALTTDQMIIL